jgi:ferredoxin-NADP reductase
MLRAAAPDFAARTFYLSGPPDMVRGFAQTLREMGVRGEMIKTDYFPGLV